MRLLSFFSIFSSLSTFSISTVLPLVFQRSSSLQTLPLSLSPVGGSPYLDPPAPACLVWRPSWLVCVFLPCCPPLLPNASHASLPWVLSVPFHFSPLSLSPRSGHIDTFLPFSLAIRLHLLAATRSAARGEAGTKTGRRARGRGCQPPWEGRTVSGNPCLCILLCPL